MKINFNDTNFTINGNVDTDQLILSMAVNDARSINTKYLPATIPVLYQHLPSIFKCQCFNDDHKDFTQECQNTELGHLFEHIMLEYLCMDKLDNGFEEASFEGVTNWNWEKNTVGTFNIIIKVGVKDYEIIKSAFKKSVVLLQKILS